MTVPFGAGFTQPELLSASAPLYAPFCQCDDAMLNEVLRSSGLSALQEGMKERATKLIKHALHTRICAERASLMVQQTVKTAGTGIVMKRGVGEKAVLTGSEGFHD
ncbi:hypothetical protein BDZ89DRAFT_1113366 [Hymenopellis radicata]|nr:hypothetical protein BDZ89DRAFT_1113366 [Hymenopellis radicata]